MRPLLSRRPVWSEEGCMARPHICFIQAQAFPWRKGLYGGGRANVQTKILGIDKRRGDSTCLIRYPAG